MTMNHREFTAFLRKIRQERPVDRTQRRRWLRRIESTSAQLHSTQRTYEIEQFFHKYDLRPQWTNRHTFGVTSFPAYLGQEMGNIITISVTKSSNGEDDFLKFPTNEREHAKLLLNSVRERYGYTGSLKISCSSEQWEQNSFSLAFVLAVRSFYQQKVIPDDKVITGVLTSNLECVPLKKFDTKQKYIESTRPNSFFLALTKEKIQNKGIHCSSIQEAWNICVNPTYDFDTDYDQLEVLLDQKNWLHAYHFATMILERYEKFDPIEEYAILGAALMGANHKVSIKEAEIYNQRMMEIQKTYFDTNPELLQEVQDNVFEFFCSQAISHLDVLEPQKGLELLDKWEPISAKAKIWYFGTKARLARACQNYELAEELYKDNISRSKRTEKQESPRCIGDYAEFLRTQKRYDEAFLHIKEARQKADKYQGRYESYVEGTKLFLRFYHNRIDKDLNIDSNVGLTVDELPDWLGEIFRMEQALSIEEVKDIFHATKDKEKSLKKAFFYRACYRLDPSFVSLETLQALSPEWKNLTDIEEIVSRIPY